MKRDVAPCHFGRVVTRLLEPHDSMLILNWRNRDEVRRWFKTSSVLTPEMHTQWLANYWIRDDDFIFIAEVDGEPVGQVAVYGIHWASMRGEVGRFIAAPDYRGQGFMYEACSALLLQCKESLGLTSVFLEVKQDNERAIHLYRQLGFVPDGSSEAMLRMAYNLVPSS